MAVIEMPFCSKRISKAKKIWVPHTSPQGEMIGQRPDGVIAKTVNRQLCAGTPVTWCLSRLVVNFKCLKLFFSLRQIKLSRNVINYQKTS
jgi:hypothetical protein